MTPLDWLVLAGAWAAVVTAIGFFGEKLEDWITPDYKRPVSLWLSKQNQKDVSAWLQEANDAFLKIFDRLYGGKGTSLEQGVWLGLFLSPISLIGVRAGRLVTGKLPVDANDLLLQAMIFAAAVCFWFMLTQKLTRLFRSAKDDGAIARADTTTVRGALGGAISGTVRGALGGAISGTLTGALTGALASTLYGPLAGTLYGALVGAVTGALIGIPYGALIGAILGAFFVVLFGAERSFPFDFRVGTDATSVLVQPIRALASSLFFICLLGLSQRDAANSFVAAVGTEGFKLLAFVAFNVFADGVSLLETRWVLQHGANAGVRRLLGLLALDIVLSLLIFLVLPVILWQAPAFLEAALFRGDRPWLGILFWSTFSTSVLFYLFVVAALLVRPLAALAKAFSWLSRPFNLEAHPVRCMAIAMALVVTVAFLAGGIVQALVGSSGVTPPP
jgi:hypothetical protein